MNNYKTEMFAVGDTTDRHYYVLKEEEGNFKQPPTTSIFETHEEQPKHFIQSWYENRRD
ncbi:hypothetical protein [Priestia flexa]|uniref:hypothetical protein n=1 Tax=Priestia flexa TaxID=86664 RepID=UPI001362F82A|nr:hypothetical protein [Priestia flexa]